MNTGQMMITVGAIMLLTLVILRVNNNFLSTNVVLMRSKFGILAVSLATSVIEEANSKAFDAKSDTSGVNNLNLLTAPNLLGPEGGEVYPNFNDFDDFNGLTFDTEDDSTFLSAVFDVICKVEYVEDTNPDVAVGTRTWHKKITVTITSESMRDLSTNKLDTLRMSSVFSYWFYR
ncbi:MAG: hypothetical protein F9K45_05880 [Melioribacteraceae bacterium]|nr:MAG: hypothetical protein F9K45_05880 [Melioribacteraceae bacterium]